MIGLLKTILLFLIFYYLIKFVLRLIMPFAMKKGMENMEKQYKKYQTKEENNTKVGETVIDSKPRKTTETQEKQGEYIDYEEIE